MTAADLIRLDSIEQKLDKLISLLSAQQKPAEPPAPIGSFAFRLQQAQNELERKGGK